MASSGGGVPGPQAPAEGPQLSTRKLIIAALLTGVVILVAFAVQVTVATR